MNLQNYGWTPSFACGFVKRWTYYYSGSSVLPKQITSSTEREVADVGVPQPFSEDSEPTQGVVILQAGLCTALELLSVETAEPQFSCRHTTADEFWFQ